jgi:Tfp pilus assembly protein PilX
MFNLKRIRKNRGMAALIALLVMIMLTLIGVAAVKLSSDEVNIAGNELNEMKAFYGAEAGLERASAAIQQQYEVTGNPPTTMPSGSETVNDVVVAYKTTDNGAPVQKPLSVGTLAGLNAFIKTFTITSTGISQIDNSQVVLTQNFECALVPIFQFAVFYDNDLEIAPGPDMNILGRVHSNGNLWLDAGHNLHMDSYVTAAGNILYGRKGPGSVGNGNIFIKDTDGNYKNMKNGDGTYLTSTSPSWYDSATTRWGGRVEDAAFGQSAFNLPLSATADPHKIIEPASSNPDSYEDKAALKIMNGQAYSEIGGVWTDVTSYLPVGTITTGSFTDSREGQVVNSTDIDMALLTASGYFPANGVIYASDQRAGTYNSLRLKNGAELGGPLSVYSQNPVYVQGDFNTINKKPAAVAGDAVTFLSNGWADANSALPLSSRIASSTTCNACILTGNTNTTATDYNGGLENLPRFLENWSGTDFAYKGSMINLWNSVQANAPWSYGIYYEAPNRVWSYDSDLDDPSLLPPETPTFRVFQRTGWKQSDVGYLLSS